MEDIIEKIEALDLSQSSSKNNFFEILKSANYQPMLVPIKKDTYLYRAVSPKKGEKYHEKGFLKYHPSPGLQRANLEKQPTFYGMWLYDDKDFSNAHLACAAEMTKVIRDHTNGKNTTGVSNYIMSQWLMGRDLNCFAIIGDSNFSNSNNQLLENLKSEYQKYKDYLQKQLGPVHADQIIKLNDFFSNKFSEVVKDEEKEKYRLTAYYTEYVCSLNIICPTTHLSINIDGVLYPSVRSEGQGICVAIKQETVDELEFKLTGFMDSKAYCFNNNVFLGYKETNANVIRKILDIPLFSKEFLLIINNQFFYNRNFLKG